MRLFDIVKAVMRLKYSMGNGIWKGMDDMRNRRKHIGYAVMPVLVGLTICACGGEAPGEGTEEREEPVTLEWYINYSWYNTGFGENLVSKEITERTGVDIRFVTPYGDETELLNSLISSDTLPDLITLGWWEPQADEMIEKDMVYALNELADEYEPYFWEVTDETIADWYTKEDGNIYCYPNSADRKSVV